MTSVEKNQALTKSDLSQLKELVSQAVPAQTKGKPKARRDFKWAYTR